MTQLTDPMERIVQAALDDAGIKYLVGPEAPHGLDFHLVDFDVAIEVKQFYSPRIAHQMGRHASVVAVQGVKAAHFLASAIRSTKGTP